MILLIYTVIFWIANVGAFKFLYTAIQPGQMLGKWQKVIDYVFEKGHHNAAKLLGECGMCFAHLISQIGFTAYCLFMTKCVGEWVTAPGWWAIPVNIIWYVVYISIVWFFSLKQLTKNV